jgi:hypothetical protein
MIDFTQQSGVTLVVLVPQAAIDAGWKSDLS